MEQVSTGPDGGAHWRSTLVILILLAAGYALTILVFQPGYITLDARYLYNDSQGLELRRLAVAGRWACCGG